jgi:alpha-amylase
LRIVDEWQNVAATLAAPTAAQFWVAPIETVSESEEGFERVYQGSQILAVWPHAPAAGVAWRGNVSLHVAPARPTASATPSPSISL